MDPATPDVCAFCLKPVVEHRRDTGFGADGVPQITITCPGEVMHIPVTVTFQR